MDKCEEMRAQFDRFCDGQLADSGTIPLTLGNSSLE